MKHHGWQGTGDAAAAAAAAAPPPPLPALNLCCIPSNALCRTGRVLEDTFFKKAKVRCC